MKIGVIRGQKQSDKRKSAGVSTLLCANWLKNCVCKVIFLLSSYSVRKSPQHHRISSSNEFNFHATPQCSNIAISVQEGAVRQRNAIEP